MGVFEKIDCYTPTCNNCGVALCWDISKYEYMENQDFWDAWKCDECDPNAIGSYIRYKSKKVLDI